jgi:hypothetical protein
LRLEITSSITSVDLVKVDTDIAVRAIAPKVPGGFIAHSFTWGSCLHAPSAGVHGAIVGDWPQVSGR